MTGPSSAASPPKQRTPMRSFFAPWRAYLRPGSDKKGPRSQSGPSSSRGASWAQIRRRACLTLFVIVGIVSSVAVVSDVVFSTDLPILEDEGTQWDVPEDASDSLIARTLRGRPHRPIRRIKTKLTPVSVIPASSKHTAPSDQIGSSRSKGELDPVALKLLKKQLKLRLKGLKKGNFTEISEDELRVVDFEKYEVFIDANGTKKVRKRKKAKVKKELLPEPPPPPSPPRQFNPLDPILEPGHICANFTLPPPPADKKRTGPRPCPVCYLPHAEAMALKPPKGLDRSPVLKRLTYVTEEDESEREALLGGKRPRFNGHQTLQQREESFNVKEEMRVHCGFVWGGPVARGTGYDVSKADKIYMNSCKDIVVASAIFGAYDVLQQPRHISTDARNRVCFAMFLDVQTYKEFLRDGTIKDKESKYVGVWRYIVVKIPPYRDPRRTGKIPKLLTHRLFPNAAYSMWMDAKLELVVDPYRVLERFLWRGNFTWAISRHYKRFDAFVEAEANKAAKKYNNRSIDAQMEFYRKDGLTPYNESKMPIISDVPEGCLILREHTPISNLMSCLWFNEVDRFTSRDQLSFGYTRDKIQRSVKWPLNMFLDCERRNFVVQAYHKDLLIKTYGTANGIPSEALTQRPKNRHPPPPPRLPTGDEVSDS